MFNKANFEFSYFLEQALNFEILNNVKVTVISEIRRQHISLKLHKADFAWFC